MVGTVSLGIFEATMELRQSEAPYRQSTQGRPPSQRVQGRTNNSQPTCPPQKLPTTARQAESVRNALTGQNDDLDKLIDRYEHRTAHSPKELDRLVRLARCLADQSPDLRSAVEKLREQARARADAGSLAALGKVYDDLTNLETREFRRLFRLDALKQDLRWKMVCKKYPQPKTIDMAESVPVDFRGEFINLTGRIDSYLANPTSEERNSITDSITCLRSAIKELTATLAKFDRRAHAAGDTGTEARISDLRRVLAVLWFDVKAQHDRIWNVR